MIQITEGKDNHALIQKLIGQKKWARTAIRKAMYFIGKDVIATAKKEILDDSKKTGKLYRTKIGKGGSLLKRVRIYRASSPGESPANVSGKLQRSLNFEVQGVDRVEVGDNAPYAGYLENGTKRIAPRPFLKNAIEANRENSRQHLEREIIKTVLSL